MAATQHAFAHDRLSPRSWCCFRWCNERGGRVIPARPPYVDGVNASSVTARVPYRPTQARPEVDLGPLYPPMRDLRIARHRSPSHRNGSEALSYPSVPDITHRPTGLAEVTPLVRSGR